MPILVTRNDAKIGQLVDDYPLQTPQYGDANRPKLMRTTRRSNRCDEDRQLRQFDVIPLPKCPPIAGVVRPNHPQNYRRRDQPRRLAPIELRLSRITTNPNGHGTEQIRLRHARAKDVIRRQKMACDHVSTDGTLRLRRPNGHDSPKRDQTRMARYVAALQKTNRQTRLCERQHHAQWRSAMPLPNAHRQQTCDKDNRDYRPAITR